MHHSSRRHFLQASLLASGSTFLSIPKLFAAAAAEMGYGGKSIPFGLQLYSVRNECAKDLPGTLKAVAKMGYKAVEFAGYYNRDAKTLRQMLDDVGLKCCGTHTGLDTLLGDNLQKTIDFNKTLGNPYLIVPSLPEKQTKTHGGWLQIADQFTEISAKVRRQQMIVGYHNHSVEFKPLEGEPPWDTFFNRASRDVVIQFDTGNGASVGGDPVKYLRKHPGRVASVHVKPYSKSKPNALIGDDEHPWKEIFNICETIAGVKWYIIEYESDAFTPLVSVEKTLEVMRRWGKA